MTSLLSLKLKTMKTTKQTKIVWTNSAKNDLVDIRDFLNKSESPQFAIKTTKQIRDEVATLKEWPKHKGTYVKELQELSRDLDAVLRRRLLGT